MRVKYVTILGLTPFTVELYNAGYTMTFAAAAALAACILLLYPGRAYPEDYTITTIAGKPGINGTADGVGIEARFSVPFGIVKSPDGTIYVADTRNNTIRKLSKAGSQWAVKTIAGLSDLGAAGSDDGTNSNARFRDPLGLAIDKEGNLYVADGARNYTIRKMTPVGTNWVVSTIAGLPEQIGFADGTNSDARFSSPTGIAVDSSGNLFVTDLSRNTIRKITPSGSNWVTTTIAGSPVDGFGWRDGTNSEARFDWPYGIAVDASGTLYVAEYTGRRIRQVRPEGTNWVVTTITGIAVGTNCPPYVQFPTGIAVDQEGSLYVADAQNFLIRKLRPDGTNWYLTTLAGLAGPPGFGHADGTGSEARFREPRGIAVDEQRCLYITDAINSTVRIGTPPVVPPLLRYTNLQNHLVLSWPLSAADFVLEATSSFSSPASWFTVTNTPTTNNNWLTVGQSFEVPAAFYRLRSP